MRDLVETIAEAMWETEAPSYRVYEEAPRVERDRYERLAQVAIKSMVRPDGNGVLLGDIALNLKDCGLALGEIRDQLDGLIQISMSNEASEPEILAG